MRITAALSRSAEGPFEIEPVDLVPPGEGEVLVRLVATGVCHTDLFMKSRYPADTGPVVLGHEGAGVVEETGPGVTGLRPGDQVLLSYQSCGACPRCLAGRPTYCDLFPLINMAGLRQDGSSPLSQDGGSVRGSFFGQSSFATHSVVAAATAVRVGPDVDLTAVAPLGCGVQTGAGVVMNVLRPAETSSFVVFGAGAVGLSALLAARAEGVGTIIAVDLVPGRRELTAKLGATATIDPAGGDVVQAVRDLTGGGATHALDTTGVPAVISDAVKALAPGGTLVIVGVGGAEVTVDVIDMISKGKTLRGCIEGDAVPGEFLPRLLDLYAAGRLPLDELITRYPFADINRAVADSAAGTTVKPVLVF